MEGKRETVQPAPPKEEKLRTQTFLDSVIENIPSMIFIKDAEELRFVRVNRACEQVIGFSREELIGKNAYDVFPKEEADFLTAKDQEVLKGRRLLDIPEQTIHTKQKGLRVLHARNIPLFDASGRPEFPLGISEDITELKQAQEESDRYFTLSIDMLCIAGSDGYFKRLNPSWQKTLGHPIEDMLAKPYLDFVHPDDRQRTIQEAEKLRKGLDSISFENRYLCKDGSYKWLLWSATPFPEQQSIYAVARDITELKQVQEALVRAKEEAERSNKFKDQFLSTMSHELRTPLNAVVGFSDLLTEEQYGPLNERQRRYINHIKTGGKHLLRLINDILDLSKIEAGRLQLAIQSVPVRTAFTDVIETMRPLADKKSQTLEQHAVPDLSVRADTTRFKQVLMNLLGNAIKFTPEGGKIELSAQGLGDVVRVEVRDSGPGIPVEEQQRIFEAFYRLGQTGNATEGTGLGLAITQRLIELHGGHLGIESQPGSGSCFYFTLPIVPTFQTEERGKIKSTPNMGEPRRILVVEDDSTAAHLLQSQLTSSGYDVVLCDQPQRALEMAAALQPSAVTIDIMMKPITGWELLPSLRSDPRTSAIPVIVVSIIDQPATGALLGADEYIVKPVEKAALLAAMKQCLNHRGRIGRVRPILVVEDDGPTREFVAELLSKHGYLVETAADGREARAQVAGSLPELVILDLVLPEVSGLQLLAEWRVNSRTADLPVFVLTSKDLTPEEKEHIRTHSSALFHKQELWQGSLDQAVAESGTSRAHREIMKHRILVVEDNQPNRELFCDWLEAKGFEALAAENLEQAFAAIKNQPLHAVLLDVQLGSEDGLSFATWLRREPSLTNIPVIAVTAHAMVTDQERVILAGCNACVPKPVDFQLLSEQLQQWLTVASILSKQASADG